MKKFEYQFVKINPDWELDRVRQEKGSGGRLNSLGKKAGK